MVQVYNFRFLPLRLMQPTQCWLDLAGRGEEPIEAKQEAAAGLGVGQASEEGRVADLGKEDPEEVVHWRIQSAAIAVDLP